MDAWIAVIGTLGGAIIGAGITWLIARDQRQFERESRWVVDRRAIYAAVLRTADSYIDAAKTWLRTHNTSVRLDADVASKLPTFDDFDAAYFEADLLAPYQLRLHLEMIRNSLLQARILIIQARIDEEVPDADLNTILDEYGERRSLFLEKARADLGVADWPARPRGVLFARLWSWLQRR